MTWGLPSLPIPVKDGLRSRPNRVPKPFDCMCFQHTPSFIVQGRRESHVTARSAQSSSYIKSPFQGFHPSPVAQRGQP